MKDEKILQSGVLPHISITSERDDICDRSTGARDNYYTSLLLINKYKFAFSIYASIRITSWLISLLALSLM